MKSTASRLKVSTIIVSLLILVASPFPLCARALADDSTYESPWISFGLGGATHRFAVSLDLSYPMRFHVLSARVIYMAEALVSIPAPQSSGSSSRLANKDIEYVILYGIHTQGDFALASISSGVSLNQAMHVSQQPDPFFPSDERNSVISVGIPLEVQLAFGSGRALRVGLTYFANFNSHYSYDGGFFSIMRTL